VRLSLRAFVLLFVSLLPVSLASAHIPLTTAPPVLQNDAASKAPAVVFIIRHAEKPMADKDAHLAPQGYKRAEALPSLFLQQAGSTKLPRLPRPAVLFATAPSKHSIRPIETITPLAQALHLKINEDYADLETGPIAKDVMSGKFAGKVVLICWHHGEIPHLAEAFEVKPPTKHWDDTVFDQIWMLEWIVGVPQISVLPEHLLPGDSEK